jgi:hypothetical protein
VHTKIQIKPGICIQPRPCPQPGLFLKPHVDIQRYGRIDYREPMYLHVAANPDVVSDDDRTSLSERISVEHSRSAHLDVTAVAYPHTPPHIRTVT